MQKFEFLRQPLWDFNNGGVKKKKNKRLITKNSGHLRLSQQPRAAHALRSDQNCLTHLLLIWHNLIKQFIIFGLKIPLQQQ